MKLPTKFQGTCYVLSNVKPAFHAKCLLMGYGVVVPVALYCSYLLGAGTAAYIAVTLALILSAPIAWFIGLWIGAAFSTRKPAAIAQKIRPDMSE